MHALVSTIGRNGLRRMKDMVALSVDTNSAAYSYESFKNATQIFGWLRFANHPYDAYNKIRGGKYE
jgi:hypothetical protein